MDVRQSAFEIVHRLRGAKTQVEIYSELNRAGTIFGYDVFLIGGLPALPQQNFYDCWMLSGWPASWASHYQERRYIASDPVIQRIRTTVDPFTWEEAATAFPATAGQRVMNEACDFGLCEGFCVPFHEIDRSEAGVSFGGHRLRLSDDQRAALHLVALYALSVAKAVAGPKPGKPKLPTGGRLTERETECLKWAAAGKTAWETSSILSISQRTVEQHLGSATRRLNTVTRAQAVAEALRRGIID